MTPQRPVRSSVSHPQWGKWGRSLASALAAALLAAPCTALALQDAPPADTVPIGQPDDDITIPAFSDAVELMALVDYVTETLGINVSVKGTLTGQVTFNASQTVKRSQLLTLLEALLDQHDYSIVRDAAGFYRIQPANEVPQSFAEDFATTRIVPTPNVRPSALRSALEPGSTPGQPRQGGSQIAYLDDLGLIVVTDSPRRVRHVEEMVSRLLEHYNGMVQTRIDLRFVSASAARDRAIELVGQSQATRQRTQQQDPAAAALGLGGGLDNLADRLTVDPQSNALYFRGYPAEAERVRGVIEMIDRPTELTPRQFFAGSSARAIADLASRRGMGQVVTLDTQATGQQQSPFAVFTAQQQRQQQAAGLLGQAEPGGGGSVMVVDERRGLIVYYGTEVQQEQLERLIDTFGTEDERIVIREYKVRNVDATALADLMMGLIEGSTATGTSPLLPGVARTTGGGVQPTSVFIAAPGQEDAGFTATAETAFVVAFEPTNTVLVKAQQRLQKQFADLIDKLDQRRPQVYIEARILAVSDSTDFRLAVESQLKAGQFRGATNFGLGESGGDFTDPKLPAANLAGLTAALIKSEYVPFILNAIQRDTDGRILSSPQLLVNDNEEAEITSVELQPTTTTTVGQTTDQVSFGGYERAGTTLLATPSISEAGYLRLRYEITLSNFVGAGQAGLPPPIVERTIRSDAVTIPSDTTIVVGGITVEDVRNTVVKVPLIGDIPLLGLLFRDTNKVKSSALLYVFITPRILTDTDFYDARLLTRGPQERAELAPDLPSLKPSPMRLIDPATDAPEPPPLPGTVHRIRPEDGH
ncbi:MAG TPA: secretin N-terminal domain-containing protein [Phycisphaerales bacterium]|nr:secretin N-terminal domain-containing protein [Phycisphaerales bacterium]